MDWIVPTINYCRIFAWILNSFNLMIIITRRNNLFTRLWHQFTFSRKPACSFNLCEIRIFYQILIMLNQITFSKFQISFLRSKSRRQNLCLCLDFLSPIYNWWTFRLTNNWIRLFSHWQRIRFETSGATNWLLI